MHNLSFLKTFKHLIQHGSPSVTLFVWPPTLLPNSPTTVSKHLWVAGLLEPWKQSDWQQQAACEAGKLHFTVCGEDTGLTTVFRVRKLHPRAPSTHCFVHFAHGAKTDNYTIKSLNPRGPDLPSIACCCCIQIKILDQEPRSFVALLRHNLFLAIN